MRNKLFLISLITALALVVGYAPKAQAQVTTPVFNLGSLPENICRINGEAQITTWYIFGSTMGVGYLNGDGYHQLNIYTLSPLGAKTLVSEYVFQPAQRELCADYATSVSIGPVYLSGQVEHVPLLPPTAYPEPESTATPAPEATGLPEPNLSLP